MKASVVIPVYNTGFLLRRMLDSVLAQTERDLELICVDDGSTDGSDGVVEEYARRDGRVRLIRQKNQGPYVARSTGVMAARGDYVYICDHDDRLHPQLLEFCIYELEKNGMDIVVFGHDDRMEQGDFEMPSLPGFDDIEVRVLDNGVLERDRNSYLAAISNIHIDQWAHVAKRELAQSVLCRSDYNLPRTLDLVKRAGKWGWTPIKLYYYNVGNPASLIKKAPTRNNILDMHKELIGLLDLFRDERASGDKHGVWGTVCRVFLVPNVKIMYNMIRRGKKTLKSRGELSENYRLFSILLYDIFNLRGIPIELVKLRHRFAYRWLLFRYRPDLDQSREALTARILSNKAKFEALTAKLDSLEDDGAILDGVNEALSFQMNHATCYYSSEKIEQALQKVSQRHHVELPEEFVPDSILHVMTQYLSIGGHTRVVERWISRAPDDERHSVAVLTPPDAPPPAALADSVRNHGGEIILFKDDTPIVKAIELRRLASRFERVVLHVNCEDIVPILAFGTEKFKRPVFLFNHADHLFGLGVSISDAFIDFRSGGIEMSKKYRGVEKSYFLDLPCDDCGISDKVVGLDVVAEKKKLGLPSDRKIIMSAASAYKYKPFLEWNFVDYMEKVLENRDDVDFVIIGPKSLKGAFHFRNRVHVLGFVSPRSLLGCFRCADLVVDSFPFGSGLSLQDAVSVGATVLSLETIAGKMDYVQSSSAYVHSIGELVDMTCKVIDDPSFAKSIRADIMSRLAKARSLEMWRTSLTALNGSVRCHAIRCFVASARLSVDPMDLFIEAQHLHLKTKLCLPGVARIVSYSVSGRKHRTLLISEAKRSGGWLQ